ncbi:hypothetical protein RND81_05G013100 [Saponaria officinalis]|uniref:Secreted protein n=1 Tax=Saponaria officinalis TaxID=3572 RepID=A0AAW1KWJ2_SAPOF
MAFRPAPLKVKLEKTLAVFFFFSYLVCMLRTDLKPRFTLNYCQLPIFTHKELCSDVCRVSCERPFFFSFVKRVWNLQSMSGSCKSLVVYVLYDSWQNLEVYVFHQFI